MSLNGSSYAYNYSNDCYPHMNKSTEGIVKRKCRYQTRRLFEIEKQAVICLIIAILLFALIYSVIMKRKMKGIHMEETPEEIKDTLPPIAKPSVSSSMNSPLSQSYVPFQPNSQPRPIPPMLGGQSLMPMNNNINSPPLTSQPIPLNNLGGNGIGNITSPGVIL